MGDGSDKPVIRDGLLVRTHPTDKHGFLVEIGQAEYWLLETEAELRGLSLGDFLAQHVLADDPVLRRRGWLDVSIRVLDR